MARMMSVRHQKKFLLHCRIMFHWWANSIIHFLSINFQDLLATKAIHSLPGPNLSVSPVSPFTIELPEFRSKLFTKKNQPEPEANEILQEHVKHWKSVKKWWGIDVFCFNILDLALTNTAPSDKNAIKTQLSFSRLFTPSPNRLNKLVTLSSVWNKVLRALK